MKALWVQMIDLYLLPSQETLPWQPNNVERNEKVMNADWYHLHSLHYPIYMSALTASMISLHLI